MASEVRGPESRSACCRALGSQGRSKTQVCAMRSTVPELNQGQATGRQSGHHAVQVSRGGSWWRPAARAQGRGAVLQAARRPRGVGSRGWEEGRLLGRLW